MILLLLNLLTLLFKSLLLDNSLLLLFLYLYLYKLLFILLLLLLLSRLATVTQTVHELPLVFLFNKPLLLTHFQSYILCIAVLIINWV